MIPPRKLRDVMGCFATGVGIVATKAPDGSPAGLTVNSLTSVSLEPPLILVSLGGDSASLETIREAGCFSVSILGAEQGDLAFRFAKDPAKGRFEGLELGAGATGAPILAAALAWLECTVWKEVEAGDHVLLLGRVVAGEVGDDGARDPLVFFRGRYGTHADE